MLVEQLFVTFNVTFFCNFFSPDTKGEDRGKLLMTTTGKITVLTYLKLWSCVTNYYAAHNIAGTAA